MKFLQSYSDFPLMVTLGDKVPAWGLSRYKQGGLRFLPFEDERFTLRGDKRQVVYKGRERSHRFTIICDTAFEYDCILEKEPGTNVICLLMEGADQYDFYKQPDFLDDPFLASSYAVYKKKPLIGEGTGKLCHIHRPEIIDAAGRRCWGDLSVAGNCLFITIPQKWLGEAVYPVVVDPTVGTTTVGSQTRWRNPWYGSNEQLFIDIAVTANRFQISETLNGMATVYVYTYERNCYPLCRPVFYSDNNNVPLNKKSTNEIDFDISVTNNKPAGWRSTTLSSNTSLASGSYIWYGIYCEWFAPTFDFGAKCYIGFYEDYDMNAPDVFPLEYTSEYYDLKLSMYFTFDAKYVRKLTQGVNLSDNRKVKADYKRIIQSAVSLRDYLLGFIFKAKQELEIKTPVTTEINLDSKRIGKIFQGQSALRIVLSTCINLEGIRQVLMKYRKPNGNIGSFSAVVSDVEKGIIFHECQEGELNLSGWWSFWAFITFEDGRTAAGEAKKVFVWKEGGG